MPDQETRTLEIATVEARPTTGNGKADNRFKAQHLTTTDSNSTDKDYCRASLRICSRVLSSTQITAMLETNPSSSGDIGEPLNRRNLNSQLRKSAIWILESPIEKTQSLEIHIQSLLTFIESRLQAFIVISQKSEIDIFCGYFSKDEQASFVLDSELIKRIAHLPISIELVFDLYLNSRP